MEDNKNINVEDKLIKAGRGIPKDAADQNNNQLANQDRTDSPDNLDERIRKAGA